MKKVTKMFGSVDYFLYLCIVNQKQARTDDERHKQHLVFNHFKIKTLNTRKLATTSRNTDAISSS